MSLLNRIIWATTVFVILIMEPSALAIQSIVIRNNHDLPYKGPVTFLTDSADGYFEAKNGIAEVAKGRAYVLIDMPGHSQLRLTRKGDGHQKDSLLFQSILSVEPTASGLRLLCRGVEIGRVELGLVVVPGTEAGTAHAVSCFEPLNFEFRGKRLITGKCQNSGYDIEISVMPCAAGFIDFDAKLTRVEGNSEKAYVALVRRVTTPGIEHLRMRWCGKVIEGSDEPTKYHRNFTMTHGADWCSWKAGGFHFAVVNGFAAGLTAEEKPGRWIAVNSYYIREAVRKDGDSVYLVSQIAGPSPEQERTRSQLPTSYVPPIKGEPVQLRWRLVIAEKPKVGWEDSQLFVYSGFQRVVDLGDTVIVDLGVPFVEFGTSYFPYSTMCENFDYYRVSGLDREGWWPFSPKLWKKWRDLTPQMKTDLRIIRSMGFDWVRLHHLELLGEMDRKDALAFLDFYMSECRMLGLKVLVDTAGSPEWMQTIVRRYGDVVKRVELENEILIPGIKPGDGERWTAQYNAIKKVSPDTQVFLSGNCNVGMFDRLLRLGVPFDRAGYHFYQHGPEWDIATSSIALAMAGYARTICREPTLGEFNWKILTRWTPEARAREFAKIYGGMLKPRAIPEFMQFHWQETLSVNPRLTRQGIRHYETIHLDRRPKPEAVELMGLMRRYARPDSPIRMFPITIGETVFRDGRATANFTIENKTSRTISLRLSAVAFGGVKSRLLTGSQVTIKPGGKAEGSIEILLMPGAQVGTYHHFLKVDYPGGSAYGWGIASNQGMPKFSDPILPDLVEYPQGPGVVKQFDYAHPITVAFGKDSPAQELEMAYQIFNTLQSATGRLLYLCSVEDLPKERIANDNLILVGTPKTNILIGNLSQSIPKDKGVVILHNASNGRQWLILTGESKESVAAAATDFTLRYWVNAKDSVIRIAGMEKGAALGNRAKPGEVNMP
ncbi:MAG: hypothetical protein QHH26_11165 [Armatimonadota bacterium]|nr:hypothetical protein [Armatimonadota bacterium]